MTGYFNRFRLFLSSRPPLVVFVFCIGMTTVAFISFAYYIKFNNIRNPEVLNDWNTFLFNATRVSFCTDDKSYSKISINKSTVIPDSIDQLENTSISLNVMINFPLREDTEMEISSISSMINASHLGYSGVLSNASVYIWFDFIEPLNLKCDNDYGCVKTVTACVTFLAPRPVFPSASMPLKCSPDGNQTISSLILYGYTPEDKVSVNKCSKLLLKMKHHEDEKLFVMLNMDTRLHVHSRLLSSSYILIAIMILILFFGSLRGGHHHNHHHQDKTNFHNSNNRF